jgi:hypothetical protein
LLLAARREAIRKITEWRYLLIVGGSPLRIGDGGRITSVFPLFPEGDQKHPEYAQHIVKGTFRDLHHLQAELNLVEVEFLTRLDYSNRRILAVRGSE